MKRIVKLGLLFGLGLLVGAAFAQGNAMVRVGSGVMISAAKDAPPASSVVDKVKYPEQFYVGTSQTVGGWVVMWLGNARTNTAYGVVGNAWSAVFYPNQFVAGRFERGGSAIELAYDDKGRQKTSTYLVKQTALLPPQPPTPGAK